MFVQRLFEEGVQLALEKLLGRGRGGIGVGSASFGSGGAAVATSGAAGAGRAGGDRFDPSDPDAHAARLRLLADAYHKTARLAANCEKALRGVQVREGAQSAGRRCRADGGSPRLSLYGRCVALPTAPPNRLTPSASPHCISPRHTTPCQTTPHYTTPHHTAPHHTAPRTTARRNNTNQPTNPRSTSSASPRACGRRS